MRRMDVGTKVKLNGATFPVLAYNIQAHGSISIFRTIREDCMEDGFGVLKDTLDRIREVGGVFGSSLRDSALNERGRTLRSDLIDRRIFTKPAGEILAAHDQNWSPPARAASASSLMRPWYL
jgi:hypothetical protein